MLYHTPAALRAFRELVVGEFLFVERVENHHVDDRRRQRQHGMQQVQKQVGVGRIGKQTLEGVVHRRIDAQRHECLWRF
jgi:hypothetical protein